VSRIVRRKKRFIVEPVFIPARAVAMAMFAAPLFFDLSLCMAGRHFRLHRPKPSLCPGIGLAAIPAHDEPGRMASAVRLIHASRVQTVVSVVARNSVGRTAQETADAGAEEVEFGNCKLRGNSTALCLEQEADQVQCCYELELPSAGHGYPLARLGALAFRGMNVLGLYGRAGLGLPTGDFGNGLAFTAETLDAVPFGVNSIAEDTEYHAPPVASAIAVPSNHDGLRARPSAGVRESAGHAGGAPGRRSPLRGQSRHRATASGFAAQRPTRCPTRCPVRCPVRCPCRSICTHSHFPGMLKRSPSAPGSQPMYCARRIPWPRRRH
jgi:hypothetical protein